MIIMCNLILVVCCSNDRPNRTCCWLWTRPDRMWSLRTIRWIGQFIKMKLCENQNFNIWKKKKQIIPFTAARQKRRNKYEKHSIRYSKCCFRKCYIRRIGAKSLLTKYVIIFSENLNKIDNIFFENLFEEKRKNNEHFKCCFGWLC